MRPRIEILSMETLRGKLHLSLKLVMKSSDAVYSPKITTIFAIGQENRRLPMRINNIQSDETTGDIEIYASYTYSLKHLFLEKMACKYAVTVSFSFRYSNDEFSEVPIQFSPDLEYENDQYEMNQENDCSFVITPKSTDEPISKKSWSKSTIAMILRKIYSIFLFLLGILLLPVFILDAIMASLRLTSRTSANKASGFKWFLVHVKWRFCSFYKKNIRVVDIKVKYLLHYYKKACRKPIKRNRIMFLSSRRNDMTGNLENVYTVLKKEDDLDLQTLLDPSDFRHMSFSNIRKMAYLCATSKVILIDDYTPILNQITLRDETKLVQLWHACGAFKTFGFSRLGKKGGPKQHSINHRNYDYAIVSSKEIAKFYAEGFGIGESHVVATGVPRTDIFFEESYHERIEEEFYQKYPKLKEKKILLFAPSFRGNGKMSAYYPIKHFNPNEVYEQLNGEYAIIMKYHPFIKERAVILPEYEDYILDLSSNSEINDLLFVTDLMITDYSSVIFEASLLNVPMLFYAYDLNEYIATRDFYYDYRTFVPGKIVFDQEQLIESIKTEDFEIEKIKDFKCRFFDSLDGKSTERVVKLVKDLLENQ